MMRTPKHLDPHAWALARIWEARWGIALHRTPVGVFFRLESGVLYIGGFRGWWWRPTVAQAMRKLEAEAKARPRQSLIVMDEAEW